MKTLNNHVCVTREELKSVIDKYFKIDIDIDLAFHQKQSKHDWNYKKEIVKIVPRESTPSSNCDVECFIRDVNSNNKTQNLNVRFYKGYDHIIHKFIDNMVEHNIIENITYIII